MKLNTATSRATIVTSYCSNGHNTSIVANINRSARCIKKEGISNGSPFLYPSHTIPMINTSMASVRSIPTIFISTNDDGISIVTNVARNPCIILIRFSKQLSTPLHPEKCCCRATFLKCRTQHDASLQVTNAVLVNVHKQPHL